MPRAPRARQALWVERSFDPAAAEARLADHRIAVRSVAADDRLVEAANLVAEAVADLGVTLMAPQ